MYFAESSTLLSSVPYFHPFSVSPTWLVENCKCICFITFFQQFQVFLALFHKHSLCGVQNLIVVESTDLPWILALCSFPHGPLPCFPAEHSPFLLYWVSGQPCLYTSAILTPDNGLHSGLWSLEWLKYCFITLDQFEPLRNFNSDLSDEFLCLRDDAMTFEEFTEKLYSN